MAKWITQTPVVLDNIVVQPGKVLDDTLDNVARYRAAGVALAPYSDSAAKDVASSISKSRARGQFSNIDPSEPVWQRSTWSSRRGQDLDPGSLVYGNVAHPFWRRASDAPVVFADPLSSTRPRPDFMPQGFANTWVRVNPDKNANSNGRLMHMTMVYPGTSGLLLNFPMFTDSGVSEFVRLTVWDFTLTMQGTGTIYQVPTSPRYLTHAYNGPAGVPLYVGFETQVTGLSRAAPLVGRVQVQPIGATPGTLLADDFVRINVHAGNLHGQTYKEYISGNYLRQTANATLKLTTRAREVGVETWVQGPGSGTNAITCFVEGEYFATGQTIKDLTLGYDLFDKLPNPGARQRVWIRNGYTASWQPQVSAYMATPRALFLRASDDFEVVQP
jgi:hypothetical protein